MTAVGTYGRTVLIVPGWNRSEDAHWQSVWQRKYPAFLRVHQSDWHRPTRSDWVFGLGRAIDTTEEPVVLVAHSLGCLTVAAWAAAIARRRAACRLCASRSAAGSGAAGADSRALREFGSPSRQPLPFHSLLSEDDPYMSVESAQNLAEDWRCGFVNASLVGHINRASGFSKWVEGERLLVGLLDGNAVLQGA